MLSGVLNSSRAIQVNVVIMRAFVRMREAMSSDRDPATHMLKFIIRTEKASVPRDPGDDPVLATLLAADADCLVSGDGDLLALRDRFPILTPAEFARRLK